MKLVIEVPDNLTIASVDVTAYPLGDKYAQKYRATILEIGGVPLQKTKEQLLIEIGNVNMTADFRMLLASIVRKLP